MHEISVLYKIVDQVDTMAEENGIDEVAYISLDIGELSGMMSMFFVKYFPVVADGRSRFRHTALRFSETKGEGICNTCGTHYNVREHEGKCPCCKSRDKQILGGTELVLKEVGFREPHGDLW